MTNLLRIGALLLSIAATTASAASPFTAVTVDPPTLTLQGPGATWLLLVTGETPDKAQIDLTHDARFACANPRIASVSESGVVLGRTDGTTQITIEAAGKTLTVAVTVRDTAKLRLPHFENDVTPILSRHGCNSSGCHGKAEGQNGFRLSVFGFDPAFDHNALTKEARGRRVFLAAPEESLLLRKVSGQVAHGGGVRVPPDSRDFETLRAWIAAGVPFGAKDAPYVQSLRLDPRERVLAIKGQQQLRAVATYSDGRQVDVTPLARFQSNNDGIASVNATGLVQAGETPGDVAVMASFMGQVDVFRALVPRTETIANYTSPPELNFIDKHVHARLRKLNLLPSDLCDDATYLRRVSLDITGTMPTAEEARRFLADQKPDRRQRLVEELLARQEYAEYWSLKWADLLRVDRQALGHKRAYAYYSWIRESLAANKPYDQFVRELVLSEGPLSEAPAAAFFKVATKPGEAASNLSQVFLGVRIACAECHHHPFDRWSQSDYVGMRAFFDQVAIRPSPRGESLSAEGDPAATHPRNGTPLFAHALGSAMPKASPVGDRRKILADWMTAKENPWLARNLANRLWAHFLGRGLVEPVDDVRLTNPPTNPELLDALAQHLIDNKYDVKQLIRTICASRTYQLASKPNATNEKDESNYSRARFKRVGAEVLMDMVSQATGVLERFPGSPPGSRAIQLWDSRTQHYFLQIFGRPARITPCECERVVEPSVAQVLHILNSPEINAKIEHADGRVARLVRTVKDDKALLDELILTFYARFPSELERTTVNEHLEKHKDKRQQAWGDVAWALLNSLEFAFNH